MEKLVEADPKTAAEYNRTFCEWRYRREDGGSLTLYLLSPEAEPDAVLALEVGDLLADAIKIVFPGPVNVATDRRSYHTFTKADELSTEQISMEWASQDEHNATPPCSPEQLSAAATSALSLSGSAAALATRFPNCSVRPASTHTMS